MTRSLQPLKSLEQLPSTDMNILKTISQITNWFFNVEPEPIKRPFNDRINELVNTLGQFLPRSLALALSCRQFEIDPNFDLKAEKYALVRYRLTQAVHDFLDKVGWLRDRCGDAIAMDWVRRVRDGKELFYPSYLELCFGYSINQDNRGSGR